MLIQLRAFWWRLSSGLWFVPATMVFAAIALAIGLVRLEGAFDVDLDERWPNLFGAGEDGSRAMLTAIASSTITVAGVLFSVTIVALSLAASQYSPRVLRTFTSDRPTQVVLGVFVGIFAYCLVVLRTIRGGDELGFVPSLAVLGGLILAVIGIAFLIFFIHHLAASIQASAILCKLTAATAQAVDELFPENLGSPVDEWGDEPPAPELGPWTEVAARRTGYIIDVNGAGLLAFARERGRVLKMEVGVGDFVVRGQPLASLQGSGAVSEEDEKSLDWCYSFDEQRTIEQDAAYGVQQIVDIGAKALSPGINDASTAVLCIDRLTEILVRLSQRRIETPYRREDGELRVIALGPTYPGLVDLAYSRLRLEAASKPLVLRRLLRSMEVAGAATSNLCRRRVLAARARLVGDQARRADASPEWQTVFREATRLQDALNRAWDGFETNLASDDRAGSCHGAVERSASTVEDRT